MSASLARFSSRLAVRDLFAVSTHFGASETNDGSVDDDDESRQPWHQLRIRNQPN